jgi:hypothetical protein
MAASNISVIVIVFFVDILIAPFKIYGSKFKVHPPQTGSPFRVEGFKTEPVIPRTFEP